MVWLAADDLGQPAGHRPIAAASQHLCGCWSQYARTEYGPSDRETDYGIGHRGRAAHRPASLPRQQILSAEGAESRREEHLFLRVTLRLCGSILVCPAHVTNPLQHR